MGLWRITISAEPKVKQSPEPTPAGGATKTHDFVPLTRLLFCFLGLVLVIFVPIARRLHDTPGYLKSSGSWLYVGTASSVNCSPLRLSLLILPNDEHERERYC